MVSSSPATESNPYFRLFYDALRPHGVAMVGTFVPTRRWLVDHAADFDVLHFHWPEWLMRSEPPWLKYIRGFPGAWRLRRHLAMAAVPWERILEYKRFLKAASLAEKRIVWTCHNLEPHEGWSWPVRAAYHALARQTDLVICHDRDAKERCESVYSPRGRVIVMPFGNYEGVYTPARSREAVLQDVGLPPTLPVLLCVGQIRPYKGIDIACRALEQLRGKVALLIAGAAPIPSYYRRIKGLVEQLPNASLVNRSLTEQEYADFVAASDVVLLPYRTVTGSSAALAALTLSRGVIASNLPFFVNLLSGHQQAGRVFPSGDALALAQTVALFLRVPSRDREAAARSLALRYDWARIIPPVAASLKNLSTGQDS